VWVFLEAPFSIENWFTKNQTIRLYLGVINMAPIASEIPMFRSAALCAYLDSAELVAGGTAIETACQGIGLNRNKLADLPAFLPYKLVAQLAEALARSSGIEHFGAVVSAATPYQALGVYADYVLAGRNLRDAIRRAPQCFSSIMQGVELTFSEGRDLVSFKLETNLRNAIGHGQVEEGAVSVLMNLVKLYAGPEWVPDACIVKEPNKEKRNDLEQMWQTKVQSSERHVGIVFSKTILHHELLDATLKKKFITRSDASNAFTNDVATFKGIVHSLILLQMHNGQLSLDAVAHSLSIGPRTLQRRLISENETFQSCVDWVRYERARQLLNETNLSINEIAKHLDFKEPNSFRRAFHRWYGASPKLFRQRSH